MRNTKKIHSIVAPANPNLDKLVMMWILLRFGTGTTLELDPEYVVTEFTTGEAPKNKTADGLEEKGFLFLDCGDGRFDGHGKDRRTSGTYLLAEELELLQKPTVKYMIKKVNDRDISGGQLMNEIGAVLTHAYRIGRTAEEIREWTFSALDVIFERNKNTFEKDGNVKANAHHSFLIPSVAKIFSNKEKGQAWSEWGVAVIDEFKALQAEGKRIAKEHMIQSHVYGLDDCKLKIATCRSCGNSTVLGNLHFLGADVVFSRFTAKGTENTTHCISVGKEAKRRGINLFKVASNLRFAEAKKLGVFLTGNWSCEGTHPQITAWHVHEGIGGARIYNGTEQHPTVVPTRITRGEILDCIEYGLEGKSVPVFDQRQKTFKTKRAS
jgi:hypothetical protein